MPIVNIFAKSYMRVRRTEGDVSFGLGGGEREEGRFSFGQIEVELGKGESQRGNANDTTP